MTCVHHWIIETPKAAYATGWCKLCGRYKRFPSRVSYGKLGTAKISLQVNKALREAKDLERLAQEAI